MDYAAHIRKKDNAVQTVFEHSNAVAELAQKYAKKIGMAEIAAIQGLIHDIGKLTEDFNSYIHGESGFSRGEIDHSFAGAKYIYELAQKTMDTKIIEAAYFIGRTIISHHGLHDWLDADGNDYFQSRISKSERYAKIVSNVRQIISEDALLERLKKACAEYQEIKSRIYALCQKSQEKYAFYMGLLERLMQSVLIDADRTDTADFMSDAKSFEPENYNNLWQSMSLRMSEKCAAFRKRTDSISVQRTRISDRCAEFSNHDVGICRLIVPTGGGKTLSSLRFAIEYCRKNELDKILYIAPFMSILEQNADEIRGLTGDEFFLEHYSNVVQDIEDENELAEYELHADKWDSPVIATTLVQFLNSLFLGKGSSVRRMHRLCRSVIIIDEVQSVPVKCVHLFNMAMNFLSHICGCTIILCSATQPFFENTEYPLLLDSNESMTGDYAEDFKVFKRIEMVNRIRSVGYSYDETAEFCFDRFCENGNLLVVVNTKPAAANLFKRLKAKADTNTVVIHISTNMCPVHRREALEEIRQLLKENKPVLCVTTQLIEAGVDISFRCAIRSLAGMDNAAQTAGRCNRNGENSISNVYIINIAEENLSHLQEIRLSQDVSRQIISSGAYKDLLGVDTMSRYFEKYYKEQAVRLSYPVEGTSLVKLLSLNRDTKLKQCNNPYNCQSFYTAGKLFSVIDQNTQDILVPYDEEAKELISKLYADISPNEMSACMRKAQKYIVSVYPNMMTALKDSHAIDLLNCGVLVLKDGFYNASYGVDVKSSGFNVLMY